MNYNIDTTWNVREDCALLATYQEKSDDENRALRYIWLIGEALECDRTFEEKNLLRKAQFDFDRIF